MSDKEQAGRAVNGVINLASIAIIATGIYLVAGAGWALIGLGVLLWVVSL